jgi:Protein of unknown function (DUF2795)
MDRASSKHGPQRDDEMERETEDITRTGEPQPGEEWRQTEPFDEPYSVPEDQMPGTPAGITPSDVDRRTDIAVYLPPHKLPADRGAILDYARQADAPDDVVDALSRLPARRVFHTIGEVVRAIGIHTEDPRDHADG